MKTVFIVNGMMAPSGAEHVLVDFLERQTCLQPLILQLGDNCKCTELFTSVLGAYRVTTIPELDFRFSVASRLLTMPIDVYWFQRVWGSAVAAKIAALEPSAVYANNTIELILTQHLTSRYRLIGHIHNMVHTFKPAFRFVAARAARKAWRIVTVSQAAKGSLVRSGVRSDKIEVIYNGVSINRTAAKGVQMDAKRIAVGFAGSAIKRKGLDTLLQAVQYCYLQGKNVDLHIASSSSAQEIEALCRRHQVGYRVVNHGSVPREQMHTFYAGVDVMVVPSRHDPLPTVVLESIAQGVPVIGTRVDGIPEMIKDQRMLFDSENHIQLANIILEFAADPPDPQQHTELAWEHLERSFSHEAKVAQICEVISTCRI